LQNQKSYGRRPLDADKLSVSMMDAIVISGAELYYEERFLQFGEATRLFEALLRKCAWERRNGPFGYPVPRDEAYYGDPETHYNYSRREYKPLAWLPELAQLKMRVDAATPQTAYANLHLPRTVYNAVLCNLYRNGGDSVGLHADAEPEMGPIIASVSLGAERLFRLRARRGNIVFSKHLPHGSLLIMAGSTQKNFKHEVPKEPAITKPRINLTYRHIEHR
jgi:alkylated DNA repair dioxygenase AlkB